MARLHAVDVGGLDEQAAAAVRRACCQPADGRGDDRAPADIASSATAPSGSGHWDGIVTMSARRNSSSVAS